MDQPQGLEDFSRYFVVVRDPRVQGRIKHELAEILFIAVCAVLCGAASFVEIEEFAQYRESWLRKHLQLKEGIPSHDTIARVFSILDVESLESAFFEWVTQLTGSALGKHLSIDGKVVRGTSRQFQGSKTLSVVSVYASELGLVLGQQASPGRGTRETEAVLACLDRLDLKGTLVTVDAGLASRQITGRIRSRGGNYLVPIKRNQRHSLKELEFLSALEVKQASESEKSHGRMEERSCEILDPRVLSDVFRKQWADAKTVMKITRTRQTADRRYVLQKAQPDGSFRYETNPGSGTALRKSTQVTYYVSSQDLTAAQALSWVRNHWSIENNLHWSLDVVFLEDQWRVRQKIAAQGLSLVRRLAFNLVKRNPQKGSQRVKLKRAAWNENFLEELVFGQTAPF